MPRTPVSRKPRSNPRQEEDAAQVVNSLRRIFKSIHEYSKAIHRKVGMTSPQVWAVMILGEEPGLSLGDLSTRMFAHPSTVSGIVDRLVERGVVARKVDPGDRRSIRLTLTAAGRRVLKASPPPVQQSLELGLRAMPPRRLRALRQSLGELAHRAELDRIDAPFFDV